MTDKLDDSQNSNASAVERNVLLAARGGSILAGGKFFAFGNRFIIAFVLARLLGAEQYGLLTLALSATVLMAGIAELGLDYALVRYVAMLAKKNDEAGLWGVIQLGVGLATVTGILAGISLYFLAEPIAVRIFHEPKLAPLLQLYSLILPFMTLSTVLVGTAHGFKKMEYSVIAQNFVQMLVKVLLIGLFSMLGLNALLTAIAIGLSEVTAAIVLIYLINKTFSWRRPMASARRDTREILSFALPLWLSGLMTKFRRNISTLLLGSLGTATDVGIYAVVSKINLVSHTSRMSIITSLRPIIAELYAQEDWDQIRSIYQTATRWIILLNLPAFLVMVMFPEAILSIFGKSFVGGSTALVILAFAEFINAGTGTCGAIIDMTGRTNLKLLNATILITLSMGFNILLIPRWGLLGAAAAVLISLGSVNLLRVVEVWFIYRILPYNRSFLKPAMAGIFACAASIIVIRIAPAESEFFNLAIGALVICIVYACSILLLGLEAEDRNVISRMFGRMRSFVPVSLSSPP